MTEKDIIKDMNFRNECSKYGLDWENFEIYDEVILINTPIKGLYVFVDKNYNIFDISYIKVDLEEYKMRFAKRKYYDYCHCNLAHFLRFKEDFYPFANYTLKQILDISSSTEIFESNHGHSLDTKINGKWYNHQSKDRDDYLKLVSYIKFLGEEIKQYFVIRYHLNVLGFITPDVYEYIATLNKQINSCIDHQIENNKRPWPVDILSSIGKNLFESNFSEMLFDIIDLLMKDKNVEVKSGSLNELETFEQKSENNLSTLADDFLELWEENKNLENSSTLERKI